YKAHRELQQGRKEDKQLEHKQSASLSNFIDAYINAPMPGRTAASNVAEIRPAPTPQKSASFRNSETDLPARGAA
ncbi:MAG: hypothetical protein M3Y27_10295, partial [Acidobacteriota bacterium]|nr:hypothetical protein [Acidobacteriota bacterium]